MRGIYIVLAGGLLAVGLIAACDATKNSTFGDGDGDGTGGGSTGACTTACECSCDTGDTACVEGTGAPLDCGAECAVACPSGQATAVQCVDMCGFTTSSGDGGSGILPVEPPCENSDPNDDGDGDGWTDAQGDCNDCTEQMNPGALDYTGNVIDEDCNGVPDDNPVDCDGNLAYNSTDPMDGARAMDLCKVQAGESWGVESAQYLTIDGMPMNSAEFHVGHGILGGFGPTVNPQAGAKLFAVSSGSARAPSDPDYFDPSGFDKMYTTGTPPGYPKESPACPGVITGEAHDSIMLRLSIRTPTNAKSLRFNVNMYTWEFPGYICSQYNDFLVALLNPVLAGATDANISYDIQGNSLSVNAGFLEVCTPQMAGGKDFPCSLGPGQLAGTGFEDHAATGWLQTTAPVENPGSSITIDFGAWDSGDGILDTTGLIDNFTFEVDETPTYTEPVPDPR